MTRKAGGAYSKESKMIIEFEKQPKVNQFYWFTAKKVPLVVDVTYMTNENTLYGFKQKPNYKFIEHHDLRFITNSTLDDLIEQFR